MVAGGFLISSTELLVQGSDKWFYAECLPTTIEYLRGVSLNNNVLMTGGKEQFKSKHCEDPVSCSNYLENLKDCNRLSKNTI